MPVRLRCPACGQDMAARVYICKPCVGRLQRELADVPNLALHLEFAATGQARLGSGGGGQVDEEESPVPWNEKARDALQVLRSTLAAWVAVIRRAPVTIYAGPTCRACKHRTCVAMNLARDRVTNPGREIGDMARWLARQHAAIGAHPDAVAAVDELREAIRQGRRTIDRRPDAIYAGPCNQCERDLYARPGATLVRCRPCQLDYVVEQRRKWMLDWVTDMLGTATWVSMVATALGYKVPASTVRVWASRGRILIRGFEPSFHDDGDPVPMYRVGDVIDRFVGRS